MPTPDNDSNQVCQRNIIMCSCGKECKGVKGLKMHQRTWVRVIRVIEKMDEDQRSEFEFVNDDVYIESTNEQMIDIDQLANVRIKPRVRLPRSQDKWTAAINFFKAVFEIFI